MTVVPDISNHNIMEVWLFDTCNFNCGYCGLVASGAVKDKSQLEPFKSKEHIDRIVSFFEKNRPGGRNWALTLTGGEPFMMPNFGYFAKRMKALGDKLTVNSNFSSPLSSIMAREDADVFGYLQASIHPDWTMGLLSEDRFFDNVALAKSWGVPVIVRFVSSPHLIHHLDRLAQRCRDVGVTFFPTTVFDPDYPRAYTPEEQEKIRSYTVGYSSLLQLEGGVKVDAWRRCRAGNRLFATRLHQGGDVTPCVSTGGPIFGNVFDGTLNVQPEWNPCFKADFLCSCDIHFQQNLVEGIDDHEEYQAILAGNGRNRAKDFDRWKSENKITTDDSGWSGMGIVAETPADLVRRR